ncbi:hypothetical protein CWO84_14250 [Methylomonas sp. Kb3]|nr:hypothetical protein CWO84_14250 [Methylomonas sp. Kb3]
MMTNSTNRTKKNTMITNNVITMMVAKITASKVKVVMTILLPTHTKRSDSFYLTINTEFKFVTTIMSKNAQAIVHQAWLKNVMAVCRLAKQKNGVLANDSLRVHPITTCHLNFCTDLDSLLLVMAMCNPRLTF